MPSMVRRSGKPRPRRRLSKTKHGAQKRNAEANKKVVHADRLIDSWHQCVAFLKKNTRGCPLTTYGSMCLTFQVVYEDRAGNQSVCGGRILTSETNASTSALSRGRRGSSSRCSSPRSSSCKIGVPAPSRRKFTRKCGRATRSTIVQLKACTCNTYRYCARVRPNAASLIAMCTRASECKRAAVYAINHLPCCLCA